MTDVTGTEAWTNPRTGDATRGGALRVLVVDDDDAIGQIVADILVDEGFEVRRAGNGREALDQLQTWLPNVILLDLMMPVMDGWTFRAAQRKLPGQEAEVPVIVVSGARDVRQLADGLDAAQVIAKPFDLDEVVAAVQRSATARSPGHH